LKCWNYNTKSWQEVDYARYANLVERYNGEIDWSAYTVTETDCSDVEMRDSNEQAEAKKQFVVKKTWVDPVQPTARTIGKRLNVGMRLSKEDLDSLKDLISIIEQEFPNFARMCRDPGADLVLMHQDAFATSLHEDEYKLLGMAIKFAGMCDKHVQIIPKNFISLFFCK